MGPCPATFLGLEAEAAPGSFQPSRRRSLDGTTLTASSGLQPTGRALPPWYRGICCRINIGTTHVSKYSILLPKLPAKLMMAAQQVHQMGSTVVEWRSAQMQHIRHLASELQPVRDRWRKSLHPQVRKIIGNWHLPLMHVLAMEAGSEDLFFNLDFSCGVRCVGRAAHSFVMPLKVTRPLMTLQELLFQAKTRNRVLFLEDHPYFKRTIVSKPTP